MTVQAAIVPTDRVRPWAVLAHAPAVGGQSSWKSRLLAAYYVEDLGMHAVSAQASREPYGCPVLRCSVGGEAVLLAGPASAFITEATIDVNGGLYMS